MTVALSVEKVRTDLKERFPGGVLEATDDSLVVGDDALLEIATFLKNTPEYGFDYLTNLTAVDYKDYFEVVYHLVSLLHNHRLTLKVRCQDHQTPEVPSITSLWRGSDLQEREIYDLLGIKFSGHPNLKRIFLWDGFPGHPLRKDFVNDA